jgi:DNA-binding transcriptional ArsR family regulator
MEQGDDPLERYRLHADICKVLTDPKRLMLLDTLRGGERSVGELADAIGAALPNASQHLAVLRASGLVERRRTGTAIRYRLAEPAIVEACDIIQAIVMRRLERSAAPVRGRAPEPPVPAGRR